MQYLTVLCLTEPQLLSWLLAQPSAARLRSLLQTPYVWPLPPRRPRKSKVSQDTYTNIVHLLPRRCDRQFWATYVQLGVVDTPLLRLWCLWWAFDAILENILG